MKLILIALNEINFDVVRSYLDKGITLPGFKSLLSKGIINTESEIEYHNLEPWIQWPSVHTGKTFKEHKVFRLGDFVNSSDEQFFEKVEKAGFYVGAICPMNASNKLKNPAYFMPDPWTKTPCDGSFFSQRISDAISQAVNDNSKAKLTPKSVFNLGLAFIALVNPTRYFAMIKYAFNALRKPWRRALFLDMLLYEIHKTLLNRKKPHFTSLFLNAGAHIQHRYFYNSSFVNSLLQNPIWYIAKEEDPILEMLKIYDEMIIDLLSFTDTEVIIATGLSQKPYEQIKYYYRLKDHHEFLSSIGIEFSSILPRMTRDFLVSFDTFEQASLAEKQLSQILVNNETKLFGKIDNRGKDIFVTLTYSSEIKNDTVFFVAGRALTLKDQVVFVAIKNGEHQSKGYAYFSDGVLKFAPPQGSHVSKIHNSILNFFGIMD
ncbi:hypothetical protein N9367_00115 [Gammaproteobacteria bacterium]|nr:hypothetical protein [Gammaproteobacteria bacterium]